FLCARLRAYASFCFQGDRRRRDLHSFPTRRSSDLDQAHHGPIENQLGIQLRHVRIPGKQGLAKHIHQDTAEQRYETHPQGHVEADRKSTRLNSSHVKISYAVFCLKKKKKIENGILE